MAIITTPGAGVSPYQSSDTDPTVLRAAADGTTVLANATTAAATGANTSVYVAGQAAVNSLITSGQSGVFQGANVNITLEEQNFNTTNQVTSTINYASGAAGSIQYNNGANGFAGSDYFTYTSGNVVTPGIRTDGYFYSNGAPFTGGGNAAIGNFVFSGDTMTIAHANSTLSVTGNGTGNVNINANGNTWAFNSDGNLTLPGNTFDVNYANGNPVSIANTGNVTFSSEIVIGTGTSNLISGLYLAPSSSSANANMYLRVRGNIVDEPTHIHFDTGNNQYYNQFIGDDNKYIQLANTGNIVINSNDAAGNSAQWTFGTDGNLTIPGNIIGANVVSANVFTNLIGSGNVLIASSSNQTGPIATWTFDPVSNGTGNTVFPTGMHITSDGAGGTRMSQNSGTSNIGLRISAGNTNAFSSIGWSLDEIPGIGPVAAIAFNLPVSQNNAQILTGNLSATNYRWTFDNGGNLTLPNGAVINDTVGNAVAFGKTAGNTGQGISSVAIGYGAGLTDQGNQSVAIGENAGANQGSTAVAIGQNAGGGVAHQNDDAVAIGHSAGEENQGTQAIAIGLYTGQVAQGLNSIAIGGLAGQSAQGNNSIIINATGNTLNQTTANTFTVAPVRNDVANIAEVMFYNATSKEITYGNTISVAGNITGGNLSAINLVINSISSDDSTFVTIEDGVNITTGSISSQENLSLTANAYTWTFRNDGVGIVLPYSATIRDTNGGSLAIGVGAGALALGNTAVAVGYQAAFLAQGNNSVAIGRSAGETQGEQAVAIGLNAGRQQGNYAVAIGKFSANSSQGEYSVAIGPNAGFENQLSNAVSIGSQAGASSQGINSVAVGVSAAYNTQGNNAVAIGNSAAYLLQGYNSVAIGVNAGIYYLGNSSIAIGANAGNNLQGDNSIVFNATGSNLRNTTANTFTVKPVRGDSTANLVGGGFKAVYYNSSTGEFAYSTD